MYYRRMPLREYGRTVGNERRRRGLSQRALGKIAGVTQGQVSRIENGEVDPRLSTAIELARALEMELTFVPRQRLPAVRAVIGQGEQKEAPIQVYRHWKQVLHVLRGKLADEPERHDYARAYSLIRDLARLEQDAPTAVDDLQARAAVARLLEDLDNEKSPGKLIRLLEDWRNRIAHDARSRPSDTAVRPAYSLDQGQDA